MKSWALVVILISILPLFAEAKFTDSGPDGASISYRPDYVAHSAVTIVQAKTSSWGFTWSEVKQKAKAILGMTDESSTSARIPAQVASTAIEGEIVAAQAPASVSGTLPAAKAANFTNYKIQTEKIKQLKVVKVKQKAVPFEDKNLILSHNNVPVFEFKKFSVKRIFSRKANIVPLLNVGLEAELDSESMNGFFIEQFPEVSLENANPFDSPEVMSKSKFKEELGEPLIAAAPETMIVIPVLPAEKKVTADKINLIVFKAGLEIGFVALETKSNDEEDLKLLRGLILFEKRDYCHVASGIFADLLTSSKPDVVLSSRFHLGMCLKEMHLPSEALHQLMPVIKAPWSKFTLPASKTAIEAVPRQSEDWLVESYHPLKDEVVVPAESMNDLTYFRAKYYVKKGQYAQALASAEKVTQTNNKYFKAQYIAGVAEHFLGKGDDAIARLRKLAENISKKGGDKDILALTLVNLGRISFQKAKFKESMEAYQRVSKDNSLWLQGLTEQGWAQLQTKDPAGAIGNMHSIQSPYFDNVYKPESYIVRSIGYLNICQYADAFKTLSYLDQKYAPWLEKIESFTKTHADTAIYDSTIKYISSKNKLDVPELPKQILLEAARQRDFLNDQEVINSLVDEGNAYPFIKSLIGSDRKNLQVKRAGLLLKVAKIKEKIRNVNVTPNAVKNLGAWKAEMALDETFLNVYDFKVSTFAEGEKGWTAFSIPSVERTVKSRAEFREQAGSFLKKHFNKIARQLKANLENNELLKYEIYAGSGENLRYQVSGGKVKGIIAPQDRKVAAQSWQFDGEFWEDEIGNYRSSLKNNCKKE